MQAKRHTKKLIKFFAKFPPWKTLKGNETRSYYSSKNTKIFQDKRMQGMKK